MVLENIKISRQAIYMLDSFKDFPKEDFMRWYKENKIVIGGGHVLEYIQEVLVKGGK